MAETTNLNYRVDGNKLIIEVDLSLENGESSTGKSIVIGSSNGFHQIPGIVGCDGLYISATVAKSKKLAAKASRS